MAALSADIGSYLFKGYSSRVRNPRRARLDPVANSVLFASHKAGPHAPRRFHLRQRALYNRRCNFVKIVYSAPIFKSFPCGPFLLRHRECVGGSHHRFHGARRRSGPSVATPCLETACLETTCLETALISVRFRYTIGAYLGPREWLSAIRGLHSRGLSSYQRKKLCFAC